VAEEKSLATNVPPDSKLLFGDDLNKRLTEIHGTNKIKKQKRFVLQGKNAYRFSKTPVNQRNYGYRQGQKYPPQKGKSSASQSYKKKKN